MEEKKNTEIVYTDGEFLDEMQKIEEEALREIDPEALERLKKENSGL